MTLIWKIYGLRVIGQDKFFYIGVTRSLKNRVIGHLSSARHGGGTNKAKDKIIKDCDFSIEIVELKRFSEKCEAFANEWDVIDNYFKEGHPLTNFPKAKPAYPNHKIIELKTA